MSEVTNVESVVESQEVPSEEINQEVAVEEVIPAETEKKEEARLRKFKVSGQDLEFNLNDDKSVEELIKMAQLGGGARVKMQEAAELKKHYDQIEKMLKENPEELLRMHGRDPEALAEEIILRKIQEMEKSPEQIERENIQRELEAARKQLKEVEEQKQAAEMEKLQIKYIQEFNEQITKALDDYKELPKSPYSVKRIADTMLWALNNGHDVSVNDVVPFVHKEIKAEIQQLIDNLPEDFLEDFIGKRSSERMRQGRLKKIEKQQVKPVTTIKSTGNEGEEPKKQGKAINTRDFFGF